jgi:acyl-CoA reductase-like NAD-dependent aldehyde dehydrogenase
MGSPSTPSPERARTEIPMLIGGAWRPGSETTRCATPIRGTDQLAYGGVKDSGTGREGPRYSIRDMTEERMVLFNL